MSKFSKSIIDKIKEHDIAPRPKWQFVLVHILMWLAVAVAVILGSMATGAIMREIFRTEWDFIHHVGGGPVRGVVMVLPYFWIISLVLIVTFSTWLFSKTEKGYKFRPLYVVMGTVVVSILLGVGVFVTRTADRFDDLMEKNVGPYAMLKNNREKMWLAPEDGLLAGRVAVVSDEEVLLIDDVTGKRWRVEVEELTFDPVVGMRVVAVGEVVGEGRFEAEMVRVQLREGGRPPARAPRPPRPKF